MAIDYNIQRNKLYSNLLSTENSKGKFFLDKKYSFSDFYKRFFTSDQGVQDLYKALTTTKKKSGKFFLDPQRYTLQNFYFSFACDLSFAPNEYCKSRESKFTGDYVDGKAKLTITDIAGNLSYVLQLDKEYVIPVINKRIDPEIKGSLVNKVGDVYVDKKSWGEAKFNFVDDGSGNISQINVEVIGKALTREFKIASYNFTKKGDDATSETDVEAPEPVDGVNWTEVASDTWEGLKKAGYWVVEKAGRLWALIGSGGKIISPTGTTVFNCINKWNEGWGYYKLLTGYEGDRKFAFEYTSHVVDGKKVKLLYFQDGEVVMRFTDSNKDVPGGKGKWSCTDTGYKIMWQNGQVAVFNREKGNVVGSDIGQETETDSSKKMSFRQACKKTLPCPLKDDVIKGKAAYKICMKCPEIKEIQENPVLSKIYFRKLSENGMAQKSDGIFGPITKAAVEEYQEMNGLLKDGIIGMNTIRVLEKDKTGRK